MEKKWFFFQILCIADAELTSIIAIIAIFTKYMWINYNIVKKMKRSFLTVSILLTLYTLFWQKNVLFLYATVLLCSQIFNIWTRSTLMLTKNVHKFQVNETAKNGIEGKMVKPKVRGVFQLRFRSFLPNVTKVWYLAVAFYLWLYHSARENILVENLNVVSWECHSPLPPGVHTANTEYTEHRGLNTATLNLTKLVKFHKQHT